MHYNTNVKTISIHITHGYGDERLRYGYTQNLTKYPLSPVSPLSPVVAL